MQVKALLAVALCFGTVATAAFTSDNRKQLVQVLKDADADNLESAFAAASGLHAINEGVPKGLCKAAQAANDKDITDVYYASQLGSWVKGCKVKLPGAKATIQRVLSADSDAISLHHAVLAARALKVDFNGGDVLAKFEAIAQGDYSVRAAGYVLDAVALLSLTDSTKETFSDMAEAVAAQAETAGDSAKFDGGITATAIVVQGLYKYGEAANSAPDFDSKTVRQLVNYFSAGRDTRNVMHGASVLMGLGTFAANRFHKPVVLAQDVTSMRSKSPTYQVRVSNTLGEPVNAEATISDIKTDKKKKVGSDIALTSVGADSTVFSANLANLGLKRGLYAVNVKATGKDLIANTLSHNVAVTSTATLVDTTVSVTDGSVTSDSASPSYPNKMGKKLSADDSQSLSVAFTVKDEAGATVSPHQAFVRLTHKDTNAEVQFQATRKSGKHSFELNLASEADDTFNSLSGDYQLDLIVGDVTIEPAVVWELGAISIAFHKTTPHAKPPSRFDPKPKIEHLFREPETRPPVTVSLAFTALALAPLLLLLGLWATVGANISGFPWTDVNALLFHGALGAIFLLYATFWLQLTIFECLAYLIPLSVVLVVTGRNMLRNLATKRLKQA